RLPTHEAKSLAARAGVQAADVAINVPGGYGYAREYDVERYFREARLTRIAPISQELVLNYIAEHVLGLPRSYWGRRHERGAAAPARSRLRRGGPDASLSGAGRRQGCGRSRCPGHRRCRVGQGPGQS